MIYVFGGSYATEQKGTGSWTDQLSQNHKVTNLAQDSRSNSEMYLDFLQIQDQIVTGDTILIAWNDWMFPYVTPTVPRQHKKKVVQEYLKFYYDETLARQHYRFYLREFQEFAEQKNVNLIVLWSVPSDYVNKQSPQSQYLDVNNYIYDSNFKNEIRPALDYFSRSEKLVAPDVDADRPNHIKDMKIHNRIYNAVHSLISGERTGIIDIA